MSRQVAGWVLPGQISPHPNANPVRSRQPIIPEIYKKAMQKTSKVKRNLWASIWESVGASIGEPAENPWGILGEIKLSGPAAEEEPW